MTGNERPLALAEHYLEIGRPADAHRVVAELGRPPNERAWLVLAESLRMLDRHDEAADAARRGLEEEPFSAALLDSLCLAEQERGDLASAEWAVRSALELSPDSAWLLCRYGQLLARAGQIGYAWRIAGEAERVAADDPETARLRMALAYVAHGRRAAAHAGHAVLALEPEDAGAHRSLAVHAADRGDLAAAARHMEEVVRQDPADLEAVEVARDFRIASHWLLAPLWPFRRFGPWRVHLVVWGIAVAIAAFAPTVAGFLLMAYFLLVAYSWLAPPLVRSALRRRSR